MIPEVDDSKQTFKWGDPNLEGLRQFLNYKLDWPESKVDSIVLPVIKRNFELRKSKQPRIDQFFKAIPNPHKSKRVQSALNVRKTKKPKN